MKKHPLIKGYLHCLVLFKGYKIMVNHCFFIFWNRLNMFQVMVRIHGKFKIKEYEYAYTKFNPFIPELNKILPTTNIIY